ncbi:uncharacterized protein LOC105420998 isoform X1 [Amborella trichopoda]|uniref:uncharacterized protein LOC105420998 isoform X1 n=1 Tax=Amborella trichopoda TaxID=13333 RepID=UPI0005D347B3|nr:uncharacterized protein LOC105420998 isoform X1 [Amborella trichopoda]|eukprot:XP_011625071.1 uncharacterized protein LOC105420998 isoform X1 [Amborella trichopoda]
MADDQGSSEDKELLVLEQEVKEMAQTIIHYRTTLMNPETFSSLLVSMRPAFLARNPNLQAEEPTESTERPMTVDEDPETSEKIKLLKSRISANASALPAILKRMKTSLARMEELDRQEGGSPHSIFKRTT